MTCEGTAVYAERNAVYVFAEEKKSGLGGRCEVEEVGWLRGCRLWISLTESIGSIKTRPD